MSDMREFSVNVTRTVTRTKTITVKAENAEDAHILALDMAGDIDFTTGTSGEAHYEAEVVV